MTEPEETIELSEEKLKELSERKSMPYPPGAKRVVMDSEQSPITYPFFKRELEPPTLSILIPCLKSRPYQTLLDDLQSQADAFPGQVEMLTEIDNGESTSGLKRSILSHRARGEFIAFVDDDDTVSKSYVSEILHAIKKHPDVVTFNLSFQRSGHKRETWNLGLHKDDRRNGKMTANHLCAWKRTLALQVGWCHDLGYGDDQLWYQPLLASGLPQSEVHINKTLYHYQYDDSVTANQKPQRVAFSKRYCGHGLRCFWKDGRVLIETPGSIGFEVTVRDADGLISRHPVSQLQQFHLARIV